MTKEQYIKILQKQLDKLNKQIDFKIMSGENYSKEAIEHKIILSKIRQHNTRTFINKFFNPFAIHA